MFKEIKDKIIRIRPKKYFTPKRKKFNNSVIFFLFLTYFLLGDRFEKNIMFNHDDEYLDSLY